MDTGAENKREKGIVLLSGGMDSAVVLYLAVSECEEVEVLTFDYGQRSQREKRCAESLAGKLGLRCHMLTVPLNRSGSALTDPTRRLPGEEGSLNGKIPSTYVPGRNVVFLALAVNWAESVGAGAVYIGAHQQDHSNYPDCTEGFFASFREVVRTGTRSGRDGSPVEIVTPVLNMTKKEIVLLGSRLGVPFEGTWSCYSEAGDPCGQCASCLLRVKGFRAAGLTDPLLG